VEENGLTGFKFELAWDSEAQEKCDDARKNDLDFIKLGDKAVPSYRKVWRHFIFVRDVN